MKKIVGYVIMTLIVLYMPQSCKARNDAADNQRVLDELVKTIFNVKNNDPVYSLFKDPAVQESDLLASVDKIGPLVMSMGEGKLDDHFKKIQGALECYFSTIKSLRIYLQTSINTGSYEWLNKYEARETRAHMKTDFENLDKKNIDAFVSQLTKAQKQMNSKFGFFSSPVLKSASYKYCYDKLKEIAQMINDLIKNLLSGKTWNTLPELFDLMKKKSGSSFSFSKEKSERKIVGSEVKNGKEKPIYQ